MKEHQRKHDLEDQAAQLGTGALPDDLAAFLATQRFASLLVGTDRGSALVIRAPADEIETVAFDARATDSHVTSVEEAFALVTEQEDYGPRVDAMLDAVRRP